MRHLILLFCCVLFSLPALCAGRRADEPLTFQGINVYIEESCKKVNAYATHSDIQICRGLLDYLSLNYDPQLSTDILIMIIAHEASHVKNKHLKQAETVRQQESEDVAFGFAYLLEVVADQEAFKTVESMGLDESVCVFFKDLRTEEDESYEDSKRTHPKMSIRYNSCKVALPNIKNN